MLKKEFLKSINNDDIFLYTISNNKGISIDITNYGATVTSIKAPDMNGRIQDIVLGFNNIDRYMDSHPYFGSTIGRYANRIAGGSFFLNNKRYKLECNEGKTHLHGGFKGFDKVFWRSSVIGNKLIMHHVSPDGDQGYPGNLDIQVTFELSKDNEFSIEYNAVCDTDTIINLTNHSYFNLSGCKRKILDHYLKIYASKYTPVGDGSFPTGEIAPLVDTPLDFSTATQIGKRIDDDYSQLKICSGYDHNYILDEGSLPDSYVDGRHTGKGICAEVYDPHSGRLMQVLTDKPGVQFYSGNYLNNINGRDGVTYTKNFGLCLETQFFPDSPNHLNFSNCELKKDETYLYKTAYCFSTK